MAQKVGEVGLIDENKEPSDSMQLKFDAALSSKQFADHDISSDYAELDTTKPIFVDGQFLLRIPETYLYSSDSDLIGRNRVLVAVYDDERAKINSPYSATKSLTILKGHNITSVDDDRIMAASLKMENTVQVKCSKALSVRYELMESGGNLSIYRILICVDCKSYPAQFFFNQNAGKETEAELLHFLNSVELEQYFADESSKILENQTEIIGHNPYSAISESKLGRLKDNPAINKEEKVSKERIALAKQKIYSVLSELRIRYSGDRPRAKSFEQLKFDNPDLPLSTLNQWTVIAYQEKGRDFLIRQGILSDIESKKSHSSTAADVGAETLSSAQHGSASI